MAQTPRTPVHFPRMKVRGHRNKAKLAARHRQLIVIPYARPVHIPSGIRYEALTASEPGAMELRFSTVTDGFGRTAGSPHLDKLEWAEPPKPKPTYSFSTTFKVEGDSTRLIDMLTGGGDRDPMVQG